MRKYFLIIFNCVVLFGHAQQLYQMPSAVESRLSSFENPNGIKGNGARTNKGAKGNAFEWVKPGETKTLLNVNGEGSVRRIWMTIDQNPLKLRSLRLQMFWDGESKPAVDVPLGDFFGYNLGKPVAFQSAFFSSGEGRSFNCYIPMPFRKAAKILLINEGKEVVELFYDIGFLKEKIPPDALYFHAYWSMQMTAKLGTDFEPLPKISGRGRFLGMSVGVNTNPVYGKSWWGEGEVLIYLDGDTQHPTIAGTGSEDYIGSAFGLGTFTNLYQGCTVANDSTGQFNFYRWHVPDPVYFNKDIRVAWQQIGGWGKNELKELYKKGVNLEPLTIAGQTEFVRLRDMPNAPSILDDNFPDGWVNFYRVDDYSSVSYFYVDKASSSLPSLPAVDIRIQNVR